MVNARARVRVRDANSDSFIFSFSFYTGNILLLNKNLNNTEIF